MAQNIADSGLSYDDLHKLYSTFGKRALVAILSNPPTTSSARTPRVTRTKRILAVVTLQTFTEGKTIYLGQIHQKLPEVNLSGVLFPSGKKIRKGHTTDIDTWGCHISVSETKSIDRLEINLKCNRS